MTGTIQKNNNSFFRQLLFIVALIGIGLVIWRQLGFLVSCFLGASTIYIVLRSPLFYLTDKKKWKPWKAGLLLVFATILVLSALGFVVFEIVASEIGYLDTDGLMDSFASVANNINTFVGFPLISKQIVIESKDVLTSLVSNLLNKTYNVAINFLLMLLVLYFMFANGHAMEKRILQYIPFTGNDLALIKKEVKDMIYGNAIGIPVIMLAQGIVAYLGYWIIGIDRVLFFAFLTALCGLVPVVGTAAVWLPLSLYLFSEAQIWQAVVLILYGPLVIGNADNACRLVLMKKIANTHPLVVIFGVILGIPLFGFWGIIFGPLLISGFLLLIKIYFMEYHKSGVYDESDYV